MKYYYLPFLPKAKINYLHLFSLYQIADYRKETKAFDYIKYNSMQEIVQLTGISTATLSRILKSEEYSGFLLADTKNKTIILKSNFAGKKKIPYIRLTQEEVKLIIDEVDEQNSLFAKYLIYMKYYCGLTKNNTDFTAEQFLSACGYSTKSNDYKSRISQYNIILEKAKIIKIERYRDSLGHSRNRYTYL